MPVGVWEDRDARRGVEGRISAPVRNLRFTQDYLAALASVEAVSAERRALEGFLGTTLVPALRLAAFTFTGTTVNTSWHRGPPRHPA